MKKDFLYLEDLDVKDKKVLCRVDFNEPIDPVTRELNDTTRIIQSLKTINELLEKEAKVILLSHQGSDIEYQNYCSLKEHYNELKKLLNYPVHFIHDVCGPSAIQAINELHSGEVLLLDNVRFMAEEQTLFEINLKLTPKEQLETQVVSRLHPHIDLYINEAFSAIHRNQPSISAFPLIKKAAIGRLFEREYKVLNEIINGNFKNKVYVLGGAKVSDAFEIIESVLKDDRDAKVLVGGIVGNIFLSASDLLSDKSNEYLIDKGYSKFIPTSKELIRKFKAQVVLPCDLAYEINNIRVEKIIDNLDNELYLDIGSKTVSKFKKILLDSDLIFMNGPVGVFEEHNFEFGTKSLLEEIEKSEAFTVVGGGDSITSMNKFKIHEIDYKCTAGGAMIKFLSKAKLPALESLKESRKKYED